MLCKVKIFHHSYFLKKDVEVGQIVDLPAKSVEANKSLYEPYTAKVVDPEVKVDRNRLEKEAIKRKLVRADEVERLSTDQLVRLVTEGPKVSHEDLVAKAFENSLGTVDELEEKTDEELKVLIAGVK
jgi:hypothetical protein